MKVKPSIRLPRYREKPKDQITGTTMMTEYMSSAGPSRMRMARLSPRTWVMRAAPARLHEGEGRGARARGGGGRPRGGRAVGGRGRPRGGRREWLGRPPGGRGWSSEMALAERLAGLLG